MIKVNTPIHYGIMLIYFIFEFSGYKVHGEKAKKSAVLYG